MKESSAEADIRIGGRSRKRVRRVCRITDKGLAFLLEFGGVLFPWLECIPKNIVGNVNLRGANNRIGKKIAEDSLEAVVQHGADKPVNAVKLYKNSRKYRAIHQHNVEIAPKKSKIRDNFRAGGTIILYE